MDYQTVHYLIAALLLAIAFYAHTQESRTVAVAVAAVAAGLGVITYRRGPTGKRVYGAPAGF